ncbi:hypothetical protein BFJ70_g12669 [Fusarium oxysporum]|nr:hypothetical protein BFJ70_g12669 [Fusarium oxysporum]
MSQQQMRLSCFACKAKKQRCDRVFPSCSRCLRTDTECDFPRSRRSQVARPMKVQELQSKLVKLEDEIASLKTNNQVSDNNVSSDPQQTDHSPKIISEHGPATVLHSHSASTVVASPILTNHGLTSDVVLELTKAYFDSLAYAAPMIHEDRYLASLSQPPAHQPPLCLQYVVMALGAYVSSCSPEFVESLYQNAKAHATSEDPDGDEHDLVTLSHTQCWSLIANFEALHMMFTQALTSLCRGIRIAQALGLHQLGEESEGAILASAQERIILEEQRRTWWFLFLSDRLVCGTTGLPLCINQEDVTALLPTSEKAFADGHSEFASPLKPLHSFTTLGSSILTVRVFIANLFHRVLNHTSCISPGIHIKRDQHEFWDRHCRLDNELSLCIIKLPENARIGNPIYNRDAVIVNTELQAAIISLHRGAIWNLRFSEHNSCGEEVKRQQAHHSQERVMNSAQEIAHILRIAGAYSTTFMNPILIFSVYLAALAFIEDFLDTQKEQSQDTALMFLSALVTIGVRNVVARSLAKQVAKDMSHVGIELRPDINSQALQSDLPSLFSAEVGVAAANVSFRCFI